MAEIEKTINYGLSIFDDTQTSLTFKEWRQMIAGNNPDEASFSNMQKIDKLLKEYDLAIKNNADALRNYVKEQLLQFKKESEKLIKEDNGKIVIGGEDGKPIEFNDGSQISRLENGNLNLNGIEVTVIRIKDYLIKYNGANKHLQITYKPKIETGGAN